MKISSKSLVAVTHTHTHTSNLFNKRKTIKDSFKSRALKHDF